MEVDLQHVVKKKSLTYYLLFRVGFSLVLFVSSTVVTVGLIKLLLLFDSRVFLYLFFWGEIQHDLFFQGG